MLEDVGHRQEAADGVEGIAQLQGCPFDLMITDSSCPARKAWNHRRGQAVAARLRVIAISGGGPVGQFHYLELAKQFGADAVLASVQEAGTECLGRFPGEAPVAAPFTGRVRRRLGNDAAPFPEKDRPLDGALHQDIAAVGVIDLSAHHFELAEPIQRPGDRRLGNVQGGGKPRTVCGAR